LGIKLIKYNKSLPRLKLTAIYFLILTVVFFAFRSALLFVNYKFFSQLSGFEILYFFLFGVRFDAFAISVLCGVFLFLINVPINSKIFLKVNCFFLNIFILINILLLADDVINFKFFNKHLTTEVLLIKNHLSYFFSLAFKDYFFVTLTIIFFPIFLLYFSFKFINKNYCYLGKGYTVVVILLESWQKDYIDFFSGTNYSVTQNFDEIAAQSIVFDKFYSNGQRSIMGLMSVFLSMPYVQGMLYFGQGLENCGQTRLPAILEKNGYDNVFVQGDKRESGNAIAIANFLGFKESYGKQDIPTYHDYLKINKGYDIEGMEFFFEKIQKLRSPFFAFYFTTTTHIPYMKTILKSLEKYPEDGTEKTGYLNRLYYSDYALGEFFKRAKKEKWFDKTIFIMLADHQAYGVGGVNGFLEKTKVDKTFKIPAIIYCPKLFKPQKNIELASQIDVVPTIIDVLNINTPYSSLGKSLFSKTKNRFIFLSYEGEQVYLLNNKSIFSYDYKSHKQQELSFQKNEKLLFSIEKVIYDLTAKDKWYDTKILN
jgi:hypothetical protein